MGFVRWHDLYLLIVILAIEVARRLSFFELDKRLARAFTGLAFRISRAKREQIRQELELCFGSAPDAASRNALVRNIFFAFWDGMFTWARSDTALAARATLSGLEHLEDALSQGKGAILWESSGFGERAAAQAILHARGYKVVQVHAWLHLGGIGAGEPQEGWLLRHVIQPYFDHRERKWVSEIIYLPTDNSLAYTRILMEHLARNAVVCIAADGAMGQKHLDVPFLGHPHAFPTGIVSLAQLSGAPLMPMFCTPKQDGYLLEIEPAFCFDGPRSEQPREIITRYARMLQGRICLHPEWYRRWDANRQSAQTRAGS